MKILQTFDNLDFELTEDQANKIQEQSTLGKMGGIWLGKSYIAFASIKAIVETKENPNPYPELPAKGFVGVISQAKRKSALESFARGLKRTIEKYEKKGFSTQNANKYLELARQRYLNAKNNKIGVDKTYNPAYKNWAEAKKAGVTA